MTTAPTPSEAERLAEKLETGCWLVGDHGNPIKQAAAELRRLQAENERLQQLLQCDTPRYLSLIHI